MARTLGTPGDRVEVRAERSRFLIQEIRIGGILPVLATEVICSEKKLMRGGWTLPLSLIALCGEQETGRRSRGAEPEEQAERRAHV